MEKFEARDADDFGCSFTAERPDSCPLCHSGIQPRIEYAFMRRASERNYVQAVFRCPRTACQQLFIAYYQQEYVAYKAGSRPLPKYKHTDTKPFSYQKKEFPESVKKISRYFCEIFNEADQAEQQGLSNIAGPGYRKALEYLIKDFLVANAPGKEKEIKKTWLGRLIQDKIQDSNIKSCAERATWLGNDETHYLRIWANKDISDLKVLIRLCVNWIDNLLLTQRYLNEMPRKEKEDKVSTSDSGPIEKMTPAQRKRKKASLDS